MTFQSRNSCDPNACGLPLSDDELKKNLTPEQYRVMRENGTEAPFQNAFWNEKRPGVYLDALSGEPLFASVDKFDSGCGWPSFSAPLVPGNIVYRRDPSHGMKRVEVRSLKANSHLGHVFTDGPAPTGLRYCINSASLRFVPAEKLGESGLGEYSDLFAPGASRDLSTTEVAIFAAGCFWGVEAYFSRVTGVTSTRAGYSGGDFENPDYKKVCSGSTGHAECVRIEFNPAVVTFEMLLARFFAIHDPTQVDRQGNDVGTQYRSAIFYTAGSQKAQAEKFIEKLGREKRYAAPIATLVAPAKKFYDAEEYHQDYLQKNPGGYCHVPLDD